MRKLMKSIFMGAVMLALPMMLTSCEGTLDDVFGQWDRPSKIPAEVFAFKKVLDEGATLTVSFKLNGSDASVTFKKEGDTYKVTSTLNPNNYAFTQVNDDLVTLYITDGNDYTFGQIFFKISDGSYYIVNNIDANITFDGKVSVNGISGSVTNNCPDKVEIGLDTNGSPTTFEKNLIVYYNKANGDIWKTIVDRYELTAFAVVLQLQMNNTTLYDPSTHALAGSIAYVHDGTKFGQVIGSTSDFPANGDKIVGMESDADFAGPYKATLGTLVSSR